MNVKSLFAAATGSAHEIGLVDDNRDRSRDSRHVGSIHVGDVIGYVDYIFFPAETWSRFGLYQD